MKFAGPAQDNCGRAVCLPSQKARSALVYLTLTSTDLDSVEEGAPAKRRRISSVCGRDHRRGPKEAAGTFMKGVCLFVGEWHQRPRCRELPKGRTTFGSGCLGYFCLAELSEGLRKSQDRRGEADRACLGIYSRGSVWASGFARNEPCLPVLEEANWRIVEFRLRATTPASSAMTPLTPPSAAPPADKEFLGLCLWVEL